MFKLIQTFKKEQKIFKEKLAKKREEQTDSIEGALYELKLEVEDILNSDCIKINHESAVEDLLIKTLARIADKAQNLINAIEDNKLEGK